MRVLAAIGGSALLRGGEPNDTEHQRRHARQVARSLAEVAREHTLIVTHGNGPHVGLLADALAEDWSLYDANAASIALAGQALASALRDALPDERVVQLLTHVRVDDTPEPSKPIGAGWATEEEARSHVDGDVGPEGDRWYRLVSSPVPLSIVESEAIASLVDAGALVICLGGGGLPIADTGPVDGVVDKDRSSAMLARQLGADRLLLLMDVEGVELDHGTDDAELLDHFDPDEHDLDDFSAGEMRPKLEAALQFVDGGGEARIGSVDDALALVEGRAGTRVGGAGRS